MIPKYFDTHCHLNFSDYYSDTDRDACLGRAREAEIWMINVGTDFETSRMSIELAEKSGEGIYASVGLHPTDSEGDVIDVKRYKELAVHDKVVAIGECGIDLYRRKKQDIDSQEDIFKKQIELAMEIGKPLIVHVRDGHEKVLKILRSYFSTGGSSSGGVIHFFSGDLEQAKKYIELGFMISFTGVITFARQYDEVIKNVPLEKIMIETDAPFVAPSKYRGQTNEPAYVVEVAKKIAEIKGISVEEVSQKTTENALKFIGRA